MRSFTDALLLLLSHDSLTHTHTQCRKGYALVIKQGQNSASQTHMHIQTPRGGRSRPGVVSDCHSSVTLAV